MTPKTKFMKMFNKLPEKARRELFYNIIHPMSMNVIAWEIKQNTKLGKEILERLGYEE